MCVCTHVCVWLYASYVWCQQRPEVSIASGADVKSDGGGGAAECGYWEWKSSRMISLLNHWGTSTPLQKIFYMVMCYQHISLKMFLISKWFLFLNPGCLKCLFWRVSPSSWKCKDFVSFPFCCCFYFQFNFSFVRIYFYYYSIFKCIFAVLETKLDL